MALTAAEKKIIRKMIRQKPESEYDSYSDQIAADETFARNQITAYKASATATAQALLVSLSDTAAKINNDIKSQQDLIILLSQ